jgi:hypothetical protein
MPKISPHKIGTVGFTEKRIYIGSPQLTCTNIVWFDLA